MKHGNAGRDGIDFVLGPLPNSVMQEQDRDPQHLDETLECEQRNPLQHISENKQGGNSCLRAPNPIKCDLCLWELCWEWVEIKKRGEKRVKKTTQNKNIFISKISPVFPSLCFFQLACLWVPGDHVFIRTFHLQCLIQHTIFPSPLFSSLCLFYSGSLLPEFF